MNRQDNKQGRGIEWSAPYWSAEHAPYRGYTANPIKGCQHACAWRMPNDDRAQCYAKTIAEGLAQSAYPNGFNHLQFDDAELMAILNHKAPSGIFIDSMSDMLGLGVPDAWTERVIEVMRLKPEHIFFVLTKNPNRLQDFDWPDNVWLGVSAPPTYMHKKLQMGQDLTTTKGRLNWYHMALAALALAKPNIAWTSIEPMSDDFTPVLKDFVCCDLDWAVIGAASNGRETIQPDESHFTNTLNLMDEGGCPVFYKGNINKALAERYGGWREDWPYYEPAFDYMAALEAKKPNQKSLI